MPFLEAKGIEKRFGATVALAGVDFSVDRGEVHAVVGENGSGKSTLMRVLAGELAPDSGTLLLEGKPYAPRNPLDAQKHGVALIHQELAICPHLSVAENIALGSEGRGPARPRAQKALGMLGLENLDVDLLAGSLTVATQQVVEIARALSSDASVVIFDEPTSSLAQAEAHRLFDLTRALAGQGKAVVYITHFLDELPRVADRLSVLRDGEAEWTGPLEQVTTEEIVRLMVGRSVDDLYPRSPRPRGEVILSVEALSGRKRPIGVSFDLHRGEVLGIAGLTGSGRTELLRTIFGLDAVRSGRTRLGAYAGPASPARRWARGMGLLSEDRKEEGLALAMTLGENLFLSSMSKSPWFSPRKTDEGARKWIEALGIRARSSEQAVGELSGGNQQKVAFARLLEHDVDVFLLDEPTRGIDVASKATLYAKIDALATQGKAILMVSSYLPELMGTCDRIAVMHRGELGVARDVHEVTAEQLLIEAAGA